MTRSAAIRAQYCDWKLIKTRSVVQLVFEVDVSQSNDAYEVLGGMPQPNQWFAIAALQQPERDDSQHSTSDGKISTGESSSQPRQVIATAKPTRRSWDELTPTQQAGIRCGEPLFRKFFEERLYGQDQVASTAELVRQWCEVRSRKDLTTNPQARARWLALENQYQAWLAKQAIA